MSRVFGDKKAILILLLPTLAVYVLLKVVPVAWSLGLSLFQGNTLRGFEFVGFENFVTFFNDPPALQSVWVTVSFAVVMTALQDAVGYLLALLYVFVLRKGRHSSVPRSSSRWCCPPSRLLSCSAASSLSGRIRGRSTT